MAHSPDPLLGKGCLLSEFLSAHAVEFCLYDDKGLDYFRIEVLAF
jgi:hypothetical protein